MDMGGMDMTGMRMAVTGLSMMMMPAHEPWSGVEFTLLFLMWVVMMVGMMLPSAAPMILLYGRVGRTATHEGQPFAASAWFTVGYLLAWCGFSLLATVAQWGLERVMLLTPAMHIANKWLSGTILVVAGLYQWSPLKDTCLSQCQAPLLFIHRYGGFRPDASGALLMGLRHGAYCVGCCWALMALLFIGGVMNLVWIALIAVFVLIEKILPNGHRFGQLTGAGLIMVGLYLLGQ
jgi:predicted metal-binding membrane protein